MLLGVRQIVGAQLTRQRDGPLLVGQVLRVRERQHEELAHLQGKAAVVAGRKRERRRLAGAGVGGIHARGVAERYPNDPAGADNALIDLLLSAVRK